MKLITTLPSGEHYRLLSQNGGRWVFEDKLSSAARIHSPVADPWGKQWKIVLLQQKQKSDRSQYPYRLVLKLFPIDGEGVPAEFEREQVKSIFAWADYQPLEFYAFTTMRTNIWLFYSFYEVK